MKTNPERIPRESSDDGKPRKTQSIREEEEKKEQSKKIEVSTGHVL